MARAYITSDSGEEIQLTANMAKEFEDNDDGDTGTQEIVQLSTRAQGETGKKPIACDVIPKFWRIEVSDTGDYIPWNGANQLKPGDQIAWLRFLTYFHHAIVVKIINDYKIEVVEMSWNGNEENETKTRTCGCSPLYRVYYPEHVLKYSPEDVVKRAKKLAAPNTTSNVQEGEDESKKKKTRKGWRLFDNNCEHSATWCKADCSRCGQFRILFLCTFLTYIRRPMMSLVHIFSIMLLSKYFEDKFSRDDEIGVALLLGFEFIYLVVVAVIIFNDFKKGRDFISDNGLSRRKRMFCVFFKSLLQSLVMVGMAIAFSVCVKNAIEKQYGPWNSWRKRFCAETGLSLLGGLIGNMIGFLLFFYFPYQHWIKCLYPDIQIRRSAGGQSAYGTLPQVA